MSYNRITKAILNHIAGKKLLKFSSFSSFEKEKITQILTSAHFSVEKFLFLREFSVKEQSRILLSLILSGDKPHHIFKFLDWQHFEQIISLIFDSLGYNTLTNFRFSDDISKYEIDLLSFKFPYLFIIDCKFHKTISPSYLKSAVEKQKERAESLIDNIMIFFDALSRKLGFPNKQPVLLIPVIISWRVQNLQLYDKVPIVAFSQLQGFINEIDSLRDDFYHLKLRIE